MKPEDETESSVEQHPGHFVHEIEAPVNQRTVADKRSNFFVTFFALFVVVGMVDRPPPRILYLVGSLTFTEMRLFQEPSP
jgi:hypothetical protein